MCVCMCKDTTKKKKRKKEQNYLARRLHWMNAQWILHYYEFQLSFDCRYIRTLWLYRFVWHFILIDVCAKIVKKYIVKNNKKKKNYNCWHKLMCFFFGLFLWTTTIVWFRWQQCFWGNWFNFETVSLKVKVKIFIVFKHIKGQHGYLGNY